MTTHDIIAGRVVAYYRARHRDLPWRRTDDPYAIWVSEVMCQQTRVTTVIPYFQRWLDRFPTVDALAAATLDDVLGSWSGLGYYSRARNLHRGAREVVERYGGRVPDDAEQLRTLPGIGRYTAGAIASLAFGKREPVVDGNVARVLARIFEIEEDVKSSAGQRRLWKLAGQLVPGRAPGDFNQGLMELGAQVCTPASPSCESCPVQSHCGANRSGRQGELPVMPRRRRDDEKPVISAAAAWIQRGRRIVLGKRDEAGLFGGLWELPQDDTIDALRESFGGRLEIRDTEPAASVRRVLSHRRLHIELWPSRLRGRLAASPHNRYEQLRWHHLDELSEVGLSSATRGLIDQYTKDP